jgi:hypothetical protein
VTPVIRATLRLAGALAGLVAFGFFAAATLGVLLLLVERMFFLVMCAYWTMNQLFTSSCLL